MGDDGPDGDQGENGDPGSAGDPVRLTDHHKYILKNCKYLNYLMNHVPLFNIISAGSPGNGRRQRYERTAWTYWTRWRGCKPFGHLICIMSFNISYPTSRVLMVNLDRKDKRAIRESLDPMYKSPILFFACEFYENMLCREYQERRVKRASLDLMV